MRRITINKAVFLSRNKKSFQLISDFVRRNLKIDCKEWQSLDTNILNVSSTDYQKVLGQGQSHIQNQNLEDIFWKDEQGNEYPCGQVKIAIATINQDRLKYSNLHQKIDPNIRDYMEKVSQVVDSEIAVRLGFNQKYLEILINDLMFKRSQTQLLKFARQEQQNRIFYEIIPTTSSGKIQATKRVLMK